MACVNSQHSEGQLTKASKDVRNMKRGRFSQVVSCGLRFITRCFCFCMAEMKDISISTLNVHPGAVGGGVRVQHVCERGREGVRRSG